MQQWALAQGTIINGAVHFPKNFLTNIATLWFNPGGSLTSGTWIRRGLTIMCCIPYKPGVRDKIRAKDDVAKATATTWTFSNKLNQAKGLQHTPPSTHSELWLALDTFCALIWTLFDRKCNYYKALVTLRLIFMAKTVQALWKQFTPYTIRSYFWAIIDNRCNYLGKQLLEQHFALWTPKFPTSLLDDILYDVRFQCPLIRNNFPEAWKPPPTPLTYYTNNSQQNINTSNNKRNHT
jgi:hypothetical protein